MKILNPFRKYSETHRTDAITAGIIRAAAEASGMSRSAVSRTFGGHSQITSDRIVKALDAWLIDNGYPISSEAAQTARTAIERLRGKQ